MTGKMFAPVSHRTVFFKAAIIARTSRAVHASTFICRSLQDERSKLPFSSEEGEAIRRQPSANPNRQASS